MKLLSTIFAFLAIGLFAGCSGQEMSNKKVSLDNEIDSVSYSLGVNIANNIKNQGMEDVNIDALTKAFRDVFGEGEPLVDESTAGNILNNYFQNLHVSQASKTRETGEAFLEENKTKEGVKTLESGLQYKVLTEGHGAKPDSDDEVTVHYTGKTVDGKVFDSSVERGEPVTFAVNQVIPGWQEALPMMSEGSKWEIYVPSDLAYGERGAGQVIPPNSTLIFEIELLKVNPKD